MSLLSVNNIGKAFCRYRSEWQRFARWFGIPINPQEEHWVLRHINFNIHPGQAIGIIGINGAGKSTLLKIITGTLQPTEGNVQINGHIASILELGMGFNPELTGRKNVMHTAGMMGFSTQQIQQTMPAIEAFAEIGDYFDQPIRAYSSGMQMRIAFSVATAWRPDLLIVDEALSVGDAYFQHKCFARIREFQAQGTTLLIVSHDKSAIQSLCDHAILLDKGLMIKEGKPEAVFDYYNALIAEKENSAVEVTALDDGKEQISSGTGEARVENVALYDSEQKIAKFIQVGEKVHLKIKIKIYKDIPELVLGYLIKDQLGQDIYGTNTHHLKQTKYNLKTGTELVYNFHFAANIGPGNYSISVALHTLDTHLKINYHWRDLALIFQVTNVSKEHFSGCAWLPSQLEYTDD